MLEAAVFYIFATVIVVSALAILFSRDIVRCAVWLLGTLGGVAGLYLLLAANFVAVVQLIVYAGGVLVLLVFGVMLTARTPLAPLVAKRREWLLAGAVASMLFGGMALALRRAAWPDLPGVESASPVSTIDAIGRELLTTYLLPFELTSVLLLAALIGAAYLARPEKR